MGGGLWYYGSERFEGGLDYFGELFVRGSKVKDSFDFRNYIYYRFIFYLETFIFYLELSFNCKEIFHFLPVMMDKCRLIFNYSS